MPRANVHASEFQRLEHALAKAEEVFSKGHLFGENAVQIHDKLRGLILEVTKARIRAESTEGGHGATDDLFPRQATGGS